VSLQVQLRLKDYKFLFQTFSVAAEVVVLLEMLFECIVVEVVVGMSRVSPIADKAALMLHPAMLVQLVVVVKPLSTEPTQGVTLEACLVCRAGLVVSMTHVLLQFLIRK
jgi:hypothetical protein